MIELRFYQIDEYSMKLQQRTREMVVSAGGCFCGFTDWSEWEEVPWVKSPEGPSFLDGLLKSREAP